MSHVVNIDLVIKDLDALAQAAKECGLELVRNKKTYTWYGRYMSDSPLPEGFTADELGKCEHALRVIDGQPGAYEIGIVRRKDGKPGWQILFDYWAGGGGLVEKVGGNNAGKLKQRYQVAIFRREMAKKGMHVTERMVNGKLQVEAVRA